MRLYLLIPLCLSLLLATPNAFAQSKPAKEINYTLTPAHPNPFYSLTTFTLQVKRPQFVKIEVLNLLGQRQVLLHDGRMKAGTLYRFNINATDLDNSKIFFYKITGQDFRIVKKLTNYLKATRPQPIPSV